MQIALRGVNIETTGALKDYVRRKLGKLDKYFTQPPSAQVALSVEKERHIVEVTLSVDGMLLRAEEVSNDMYASVDLVVDKLERQIHKYKTRINRKARKEETIRLAVGNHAPSFEEEDFEFEDEEYKVVKSKRFALKPMDVQEAILQMNLLGHDFFVFANSESEEVNVVYRRHDGNYGLIEPM